jgi:hypothetical protein
LETKLTEFKQKMGLVLLEPEQENVKRKLSEQEQKEALGGLSSLVIQAAVLGAIALKRSPIPGKQWYKYTFLEKKITYLPY